MAAQKQIPSPALVMVALLLLTAATPLAHGQLSLPLFDSFTINGGVCCTPTGSCTPGAPGIPGIPLNVTCSSSFGSINVAQGVTGVNGFYNITVANVRALLGSLPPFSQTIPCAVTIKPPLNETVCPILSTTSGTLVGLLSVVNILVSQVLGLLVNLTAAVFIRV